MDRPSLHDSQQIAIRMVLGFIPVLKVRTAIPDKNPGDWKWSRWRLARFWEMWAANKILKQQWKD